MLESLDQVLMILRTLALSMVASNSHHMVLVLVFKWKTPATSQVLANTNLKSKCTPKLVALWPEIWAIHWYYQKPQDQAHTINRTTIKLRVRIQCGHCQSHLVKTCTGTIAWGLGNIKPTSHTKVLLTQHQPTDSAVTREILSQKQTPRGQELTIKAWWSQGCRLRSDKSQKICQCRMFQGQGLIRVISIIKRLG